MASQMISKMQGSATLSGTLGVATVVHPGLSTSHFDINRRTSFLSSTLALSPLASPDSKQMLHLKKAQCSCNQE